MIKRELFKNYKWKAVAVTAALIGVSATFGGCATQTSAPVSTTIQEEAETPATLSVVSESETASDMSLPEGVKVADIVSPTIGVTNERLEIMEGTELDALDVLNGVSAIDDEDGDITDKVTASEVDISLLDAEQTITYTVLDAAGNVTTAISTLMIKSDKFLSDTKPEPQVAANLTSEKAPSDKVVVSTPTESPSVEDTKVVTENPVSDQSVNNSNQQATNVPTSSDNSNFFEWQQASVGTRVPHDGERAGN